MKCRSVEILAAIVLFVSASPVMAVIEFKDGLTHDIDYQINGEVWVDYESPGLGTTLNILDWARIYPYVRGWEDSIINMSGGSVSSLSAYDSSQVAVSGGLFGGELRVSDNAVLTIHGWDFAVDGMPVGYTELYSIFGGSFLDEPYRQLKGTLLSGDPINNQFRIGLNGKIVLVPEPASAVILGLGGFFLVLRRRRRQA